ncbi:uncharacterized protein KQ657_001022 [Scheffersomyces spartinae]|uniref:Histone deacetylase domain-containing protein n=1 Tax=Scheffersomyces spartinae TaxID=45513 RepID=A0A9P8AI54_9ASCO|nr:uncharacterized protein KQ657_001022 [Scheffersomyces spartinae]KAG7193259.1 hypothetical protein KQ657_001022 [Scheffersomyces spartinae]
MSNLREKLEKENDSEESLISQFETTLTFRPTSNADYGGGGDGGDDITIDQTQDFNVTSMNYTRDVSIVGIEELEEEELMLEQIPKFKTRNRYSLLPNLATKEFKDERDSIRSSSRDGSPSLSSYGNLDSTKYKDILRPSPLIDIALERFHKAFDLFLDSNPHIKSESPRFRNEKDRTLVVLSPYSSEHAFGRLWVSKSYLSTIFERPQRLLASCLGISAALTMFPFFYQIINSTKRGSLFSPHVRRIHGKNWPKKLVELCLESHDKLLDDEIEVPEGWNAGDIYLTPKTINAIEGVIGTIETAIDNVIGNISSKDNYDLAFVVIRPPGHHSHACLPSGFCLLNNVQIGIEYAADKYKVSHVAILDIDLHHGDGSQDICWERAGFAGDYGKDDFQDLDEDELRNNPRNDYGKRTAGYPKVGYFSLHDIRSYPTELGYATRENIKNASLCIMDHDLTIWNVHLQSWATEDEFYKHYLTKYVALLNRANQFLNTAKKEYEAAYQEYLTDLAKYNKYLMKPHLYGNQSIKRPEIPQPFNPLIMISAGFDALEYENPQMQRHGINVPTSFYAKFTKDVVKLAKIHTNGKVVSFLEGGYSDGALSTGIFSHLIGLTNDDDIQWNETWGSQQVMKELSKGCKKNWTPYKNPNAEITVWANEVIKLGRAMMPNAILPANYIYHYEPTNSKSSGMTASSIGSGGGGTASERIGSNNSLQLHSMVGSKDLVNPPPIHKMVKEILADGSEAIESSPIKADPEDSRRIIRHTRSYFKKVNNGKDR